MQEEIIGKIKNILGPEVSEDQIKLVRPTDSSHGDFTTSIAFIASAKNKEVGIKNKEWENPLEFAQKIADSIIHDSEFMTHFEKIEVAGPGFINFFIAKESLFKNLLEILEKGEKYGSSDLGKGKKARVEFVSANPTGPLHFGNARGGPIGDVISNVLQFCGYEVLREYINNDKGNQVLELGKTIAARAGFIKVKEDELTYKGEYINELAEKVKDKLEGVSSEKEIMEKAGEEGVRLMFKEIIQDCEIMGIKFDHIVHESDLQKKAPEILAELEKKRLLKEYEGATWFAPKSEYLKDKDAVVIKSDGNYTYFTADVVYHKEKFENGYDLVIDVFGSNTSGHIPKLKALAQALHFDLQSFKVILYQFVRIKRGDKILKMSKRAGNFVTAREVLDEVGKDALRYFILSTRPETHMDFDLELAKKRANENPVYYVQYAHARICSILAKSGTNISSVNQSLLNSETEVDLIRHLVKFPQLVEEIAGSFEVHKLTTYAFSLADKFHRFYEQERVISQDKELTNARLCLAKATQIALKNTLNLLGISAPEKM